MLGLDTVESVAHVIQVALTPVFLLSGVASLLGVLSTRLARVADRVNALAEQLEADGPIDRRKLRRRLAYLRRRSHVLDAAVMMGTLGGVVLCGVASVRRHASRSARCVLIRGPEPLARPRQSNAATRLHTGSRTQAVALPGRLTRADEGVPKGSARVS